MKNQVTSFFKGDGDLMVDKLIAACAVQKAGPTEPLPGFGRDLVPYFNLGSDGSFGDINEVLSTQTSSNVRTVSPPSGSSSKRVKKHNRKKNDFVKDVSDFNLIPRERASKPADKKVVPRTQLEQPSVNSSKSNKPATSSALRTQHVVSLEQQQKVAEAFAASAAASKASTRVAKNSNQVVLQPVSSNTVEESAFSSPEKVRWAGGKFTNSPNPTHVPLPNVMMSSPFSSSEDLTSLQQVDFENPRLITPEEILQKALSSCEPVNTRKANAMYQNTHVLQSCSRAAANDNLYGMNMAATHALREMLNF